MIANLVYTNKKYSYNKIVDINFIIIKSIKMLMQKIKLTNSLILFLQDLSCLNRKKIKYT